jgi:hypothetical protein
MFIENHPSTKNVVNTCENIIDIYRIDKFYTNIRNKREDTLSSSNPYINCIARKDALLLLLKENDEV